MADFKKHKDYTKVRISVETSPVECHRLSIASFKTGHFFFNVMFKSRYMFQKK